MNAAYLFDRLMAVSIQTAILVLVVFAFTRWSAISARVRAALWTLVFIHALAGLAFSVPVPVFSPPASEAAPAAIVPPSSPGSPRPVSAQKTKASSPASLPDPKAAAISVWALGAALLFFSQLRRERSARRILADSSPASALIEARAQAAAAEMGIRNLHIRVASGLAAPCVAGIIRPTIYLPAVMADDEEEAVRAVLVHELAHLRHSDLPVSVLATLTRCLFFFHPLTWLAHREWAIQCETACDEEVLRRSTIGRKAYCRLLIRFAQGRPLLAATIQAATEGFTHLHRRISEMKNTQRKQRGAAPVAAIAALAVSALVAVPVTLTTQSKTHQGRPTVTYQQFTPEQIAAAEAMRREAIAQRDAALAAIRDHQPEVPVLAGTKPEPKPAVEGAKQEEKEKLPPAQPLLPGAPAPIFGHNEDPRIPRGVYLIMPPASKVPADWLTWAGIPREPGVYEVQVTQDPKEKKGVKITFLRKNATVSGG